MVRVDKLAISAEAIKELPPLLRASGKHEPATATQTAHWVLEVGEFSVSLSEQVLLCPDDTELSSVLDIWDAREKVLSVCWMPDKPPTFPKRIVQCKPGPWQALLRAAGGRER
jgi:hypothetical protein